MSVSIHWFRRDFRLTDNTALRAAREQSEVVVPVYIVSDWKKQHRWTGAPRQEFLCGCLADLAKSLEDKGSRLIIRQGPADEALEKLARETGATSIHFNRDPDPFGRAMEKKIEALGHRLGIRVHAHQDVALHERNEVLTGNKSPYKVFTPYAKSWLKLDKPEPQGAIRKLAPLPKLHSEPLPTLATWGLKSDAEILPAGEAAARKRLSHFLDGPIYTYDKRRDLPAEAGTSRLSQDLRHGLLSIREVYAKCQEAAKGVKIGDRRSVEIYVNELIWREFYQQVLWHWPEVLDHEFNPDYRRLKWHYGEQTFARWRDGQTGFPIVDAGMRQLAATGFLHNRVRMIVAMFLTKDLHLDWRMGEQWFMQRLVDGEIASNNGGWQWSASTGTDAAPYFRIQNPWTQSGRFDPEGEYIRHWVPELRDVPPRRFSAPPADGRALAKGYPLPMVDHARERDVTLELYRV